MKECFVEMKEMAMVCKAGFPLARKLALRCTGVNLRLECDMAKEQSNNGNQITPLESYKDVDRREIKYTGRGKMTIKFK